MRVAVEARPVAAVVHQEPGRRALTGGRAAAEMRRALQHADAHSRAREVAGHDRGVVSAAEHDGVVARVAHTAKLGPEAVSDQGSKLASVKGATYHAAMELRQLTTFVAVAEELHFRRAAERLHLAQPSVSQQIRTLEAELGTPLFERNRRGAALTAAGEALLPEARELLARAEQAAATARATGIGQRGRLRLSLTRSLTGGPARAVLDAHPGGLSAADP